VDFWAGGCVVKPALVPGRERVPARLGRLALSEAAEPSYFLCPTGGVGGFEDDGHVVEAGVVHETRKEPVAEEPVAEGFVTVDM